MPHEGDGKVSDDEPIGKGSTTLDYLKVRHEWLGVMIDDAAKRERELLARVKELEAERDRLRGAVAKIRSDMNRAAPFAPNVAAEVKRMCCEILGGQS
jgi:hypothetical protein